MIYIIVFVIGLTIGTLWGDKVSGLYYIAHDRVADWFQDLLNLDEDSFVMRHRKLFISLVVVLLLIVAGGTYMYFNRPQKMVALGETRALMDQKECGNMYNITVTQTHIDQGFISVGKGECVRIYPLVARPPSSLK